MSTMPTQIVLALVQMRRNLRGTIKTGEQALLAIDTILEALRPKCKSCLFEHGLVTECRCKKNESANGSLKRLAQ
jgi:hypothetical protein